MIFCGSNFFTVLIAAGNTCFNLFYLPLLYCYVLHIALVFTLSASRTCQLHLAADHTCWLYFFLQVTLVDYTFFCRSHLLLDASYDEERISEGQMVIAMNKHREICALHMSGTHLLHKDQVCAALAYRLLHGVWIWRCFFSKTPRLTVE